jgi:hypothetical protein
MFPGSGSDSSQRSRSGSVYQQAKIVRKTLIPTVLWLLNDFLSFKNYVNVVSKSYKQKTYCMSRMRNTASNEFFTNNGSWLYQCCESGFGSSGSRSVQWGIGECKSRYRNKFFFDQNEQINLISSLSRRLLYQSTYCRDQANNTQQCKLWDVLSRSAKTGLAK